MPSTAAGRDAEAIHQGLVAMADPQRAEGERAYLKNHYDHLGVAMAPGRKLVTGWLRDTRPDLGHVLAVAAALWPSEVFEDRRSAVELWVAVAGSSRRSTSPPSRPWCATPAPGPWSTPWPTPWRARSSPGTPTSPPRTSNAGRSTRARSGCGASRCSRSPRPVRAGVVPFETFAVVADGLLDEREFFIRKSIGWVLRDIGRDDPASVEAFCRPRMGRMSTVTWAEARKRLPPEVVAELTALR